MKRNLYLNSQITIACVFLAAGSSKRMGKANKLLLPYKKSVLVQYTYSQLDQSQIDKIVIVTGHQRDKIENALQTEKADYTYNINFDTGMTSSIQTGLQFFTKAFSGYMIALSDMPYLKKADYNILIDTFKQYYKNEALIIVPTLNNQSGNPVIFSKEFLPELLAHENKEGCKAIIQKNNTFVKLISLKNENAFKDIDKQTDYLELTNV